MLLQTGPVGVACGTLLLATKPCSRRELSYGSCPPRKEGALSGEPALDQVTSGQTDAHDLVEARSLLRSDVFHALTLRLHAASDVEQTNEAS